MEKPTHRRNQDYSRKSRNLQPKETLLIICEGETEQIYFEKIKESYKLATVNIEIHVAEGRSDCKTIEVALNKPKNAKDYDQIWCVFDTETPKISANLTNCINRVKERNLRNNKAKPPEAEIYLAVSNPCIEYWFILHFEKTTASFSCYDDTKKKLHSCGFADYDKNQKFLKEKMPKLLLSKVDTAVEHAKKCHKELQASTGEDYPNPCSTLYLLFEKLQELKKKPYD